jgi:hypothetical protein
MGPPLHRSMDETTDIHIISCMEEQFMSFQWNLDSCIGYEKSLHMKYANTKLTKRQQDPHHFQ